METEYVAGLPKSLGGSGDSAPFTAKGIYYGIKASLKECYGNDSLAGRTVAVQGAGNVGEQLIALLREENAKVYVSDIVEERMVEVANKYKAVPVARSEEHTSELQSLMRISYAVFCLNKKKTTKISS